MKDIFQENKLNYILRLYLPPWNHEKIVDEILIPMYDTFLNKDMNYDYFKESSKDTKGELAEKEDQQELFSKTTWNQEEYFFYDMESEKKHDNRDE